MSLSVEGRKLVADALPSGHLASVAVRHLESDRHDSTLWPTRYWQSNRFCVGGAICLASGFRPGADMHRTHTGDTWWAVLEALMGDVCLPSGLSLFAPEAHEDDILVALFALWSNTGRAVA